MVSKKRVPVKKVEETAPEDVIKFGKGLNHYEKIEIKVCAVNNGYSVTVGNNYYVFENSTDVVAFVESSLPMRGIDKKFVDCLSDDNDLGLDDDDGLPF